MSVLTGSISLTTSIRLFVKSSFKTSQQEVAVAGGEPWFFIELDYSMYQAGKFVNPTVKFKHRILPLSASYLNFWIMYNERLPMDIMMSREEAKHARERICGVVASLICDSVGVAGLEKLEVTIMVHSRKSYEEFYRSMFRKDKACLGRKEGEKEMCAICLEEMVVGEEDSRTPCGHHFHGGCISKWLKRGDLCPLCRSKIYP